MQAPYSTLRGGPPQVGGSLGGHDGLGLLLQTHTFLFLGVGPATIEQFLQAVEPEQRNVTQRHFAVIPDEGVSDLWSTSLARFGIAVLPYSQGRHAEIYDFVQRLAHEYELQPNRARHTSRMRRPLEHFRIKHLRLTNIGLFKSFELDFSSAPINDKGDLPWTVIFGENGTGKSTILRAIAIALAGEDANATARALLRTDAREGTIELQTELGDEPLRTVLLRDGARVRVTCKQTSPVAAGFALALGFPSLRGGPSPNPPGPREQDRHGPETSDLLPLAIGEADKRLGNLKQWLVNVLVAANSRTDRRNKAIRALLDDIIRKVIPGDVRELADLDGQPFTIRVKVGQIEVPFEELSLGMASIFNWIGVLVQRLHDVYPESPRHEREHAIVLVDEIDAHLHPSWQRKLVELTKEFFPNVQVIATSHSALLAGSLRQSEVCVLDNAGRRLEVTFDPYGLSSSALLTSELFRLPFDRNREVEALIREYTSLVQKANRTDTEEGRVDELREQLRPFGYAVARAAPRRREVTDSDREAVRRALAEVTPEPTPKAVTETEG